jgi:predicted transcriptional regulator
MKALTKAQRQALDATMKYNPYAGVFGSGITSLENQAYRSRTRVLKSLVERELIREGVDDYEITDAGRDALKSIPKLTAAQRDALTQLSDGHARSAHTFVPRAASTLRALSNRGLCLVQRVGITTTFVITDAGLAALKEKS